MQPNLYLGRTPPVITRTIPASAPPPRLEAHEKTRINSAVSAAKRLYPGAIGEALADTLSFYVGAEPGGAVVASGTPRRRTPPAAVVTRAVSRAAVVVALLFALAGCGVPAAVTPPGSAPTVDAPVSAIVPAPIAVEIPAIGAASSLVPLGLDEAGALAVPPVEQPGQAGWYEQGVIPGQAGPAVIAGHVSGRPAGAAASVPGVFARLSDLEAGDEVLVERADGSTLRFLVQRVEVHDKDVFPTGEVYRDTDGPELRLITCGGSYDPAARNFEANVIAWAVLA